MLMSEASLKKNYVSGGVAGCLKKGRLGTFFFFFFLHFFFSPKMYNIFLPNKKKRKKKKKNCGRPTGLNYGHPLDRLF